MDAIILDSEIMDGASARDWRVLHAIELHQGYKSWRCKLSLSRIAAVARCSRKGAGNSCRWWAKMGVVKIVRTGKANVYEIIHDFRPSLDGLHRERHISHETQKRGPRGRFAPSTAHQSPQQTAHQSPPSTAQGSEREVFNEKSLTRGVPPPPPEGGNGRAPEASARPSLIISDDTIKKLIEAMGPEAVVQKLREGNYPIPPYLLQGEQKCA